MFFYVLLCLLVKFTGKLTFTMQQNNFSLISELSQIMCWYLMHNKFLFKNVLRLKNATKIIIRDINNFFKLYPFLFSV